MWFVYFEIYAIQQYVDLPSLVNIIIIICGLGVLHFSSVIEFHGEIKLGSL
jgi:hypothetical protein